MKTILIIGPPGAGKGTISKFIKDKYNIKHLSTGDIIREEINKGTEFGKYADSIISKGDFLTDEDVNKIITQKINENKNTNNILLLDGYPRTKEQAEYINSIIEIEFVIYLHVNKNVATNRLLERKKIENRKDDKKSIIEHRFAVYESLTRPVIDLYTNENKIMTIDGNKNLDGVKKEISTIFDKINLRA